MALAELLPERRSDPWQYVGPVGVGVVAVAMTGLALGAALAGMPLSPMTWYLARASGFTMYLLLWLSVVSGLGMTTRLLPSPGGPGGMWALHRITTELSLILLALHLSSLALDQSVSLGMLGVLIPFVSDVRQPWTDLGIMAAYGTLIVAASFSVRHLIGWRVWRVLHIGSLPLWLIALIHGVGAGSDSGQIWAGAVYALTAGLVMFLVVYRLLRAGRRGWGASRPSPQVLDRDVMRQRMAEYQDRCASSS